ncbi:hypothetical protein KG091_00725 [Carnobacteriaceae bacterium zg-ZUI78]|nr:hypothetical protein [Carnobacteriaceae bacterium zg-ZUI78]
MKKKPKGLLIQFFNTRNTIFPVEPLEIHEGLDNLEVEHQRLVYSKDVGYCQYRLLKQGHILYEDEFSLPLDQSIESILEDLLQKEAAPKVKKSDKTSFKTPIYREKRAFPFVSVVAIVLSTVSLLGSCTVYLSQQTHQKLADEVISLRKTVDNLSSNHSKTQKADVFSRFFLSAYYQSSNDENTFQERLRPYLDTNTRLSFIKQTDTLRNMLLYDISFHEHVVTVTYVITLQKDNTIRSYLVTFDINTQENEMYKVTSDVKQTLFSINK